MILSKGAVCDSKKSRFIKEQEASQLLSNLIKIKNTFKCCVPTFLLVCFLSLNKSLVKLETCLLFHSKSSFRS